MITLTPIREQLKRIQIYYESKLFYTPILNLNGYNLLYYNEVLLSSSFCLTFISRYDFTYF